MANIARLDVPAKWTDLETAITGFTPAEDDIYEIQNIGNKPLQIYGGASAPTSERDGFVAGIFDIARWKVVQGEKCYVRAQEDTTTINIAKIL